FVKSNKEIKSLTSKTGLPEQKITKKFCCINKNPDTGVTKSFPRVYQSERNKILFFTLKFLVMNTDFKIIAMIALIMIGFFSCKKQNEEVKPEQKPKKQLYALKIDVVEADKSLEKITYEKGIIVGTKEDFKRMSRDKGKDAKGMSMRMVGPHNHVFWPNSTGPVSTEKRCFQQIYQIKLQHWNQWKAEANEKCKPIVKVVHCPLAATYDYGPFDWDHKSFTIYPDISACAPIP